MTIEVINNSTTDYEPCCTSYDSEYSAGYSSNFDTHLKGNSSSCDNCTCGDNKNDDQGMEFDFYPTVRENMIYQVASVAAADIEDTTKLILRARTDLLDAIKSCDTGTTVDRLQKFIEMAQDRTVSLVSNLERLFNINKNKE